MTKAELDRMLALPPRERLELAMLLLGSVRGSESLAAVGDPAGRGLHELIEERLREMPSPGVEEPAPAPVAQAEPGRIPETATDREPARDGVASQVDPDRR